MVTKSQIDFLKNDLEEGSYGRSWSYGSSYVSDDSDVQNVDWKLIFEAYLEEKKDQYFWAKELLEFYKTKFIPREKRWIDSMFYERFALNLFGPRGIKKFNFDLTNYNKTQLEASMIRAGASDNLPKEGIKMEENINDKDFINKALAQVINDAIKDERNPFNILIAEFRKIFLKRFTENINEYEANLYKDYRENFEKSKVGKLFVPKALAQRLDKTRDSFYSLQRFIKLLMHCLTNMYVPVVGADKFNNLREFLVNCLVDAIINKDVYTVIFMFIRMEHQAEEMTIENKIKDLHEIIKPQHLNINTYLSLDESTGNQELINNITKYVEKRNIKPNIENWQDELIQRATKNQPYFDAIEKLREVAKLDTPMKKLKCITELNSVICKCIDDFWKGIPVPQEKLSIDADQYLSILVYIVIKAKVRDLFTNIALANEFATLGSTSSYNAYCLTTLQASFFHLLNIDIALVLKPRKISSLIGE